MMHFIRSSISILSIMFLVFTSYAQNLRVDSFNIIIEGANVNEGEVFCQDVKVFSSDSLSELRFWVEWDIEHLEYIEWDYSQSNLVLSEKNFTRNGDFNGSSKFYFEYESNSPFELIGQAVFSICYQAKTEGRTILDPIAFHPFSDHLSVESGLIIINEKSPKSYQYKFKQSDVYFRRNLNTTLHLDPLMMSSAGKITDITFDLHCDKSQITIDYFGFDYGVNTVLEMPFGYRLSSYLADERYGYNSNFGYNIALKENGQGDQVTTVFADNFIINNVFKDSITAEFDSFNIHLVSNNQSDALTLIGETMEICLDETKPMIFSAFGFENIKEFEFQIKSPAGMKIDSLAFFDQRLKNSTIRTMEENEFENRIQISWNAPDGTGIDQLESDTFFQVFLTSVSSEARGPIQMMGRRIIDMNNEFVPSKLIEGHVTTSWDFIEDIYVEPQVGFASIGDTINYPFICSSPYLNTLTEFQFDFYYNNYMLEFVDAIPLDGLLPENSLIIISPDDVNGSLGKITVNWKAEENHDNFVPEGEISAKFFDFVFKVSGRTNDRAYFSISNQRVKTDDSRKLKFRELGGSYGYTEIRNLDEFVELSLSNINGEPGDIVSMDINVENLTDITDISIELVFDTAYLEYTSIEENIDSIMNWRISENYRENSFTNNLRISRIQYPSIPGEKLQQISILEKVSLLTVFFKIKDGAIGCQPVNVQSALTFFEQSDSTGYVKFDVPYRYSNGEICSETVFTEEKEAFTKESQLIVYPNPSSQRISLKYKDQIIRDFEKVVIYDIIGLPIKELTGPLKFIKVDDLKCGTYILKMYDKSSTSSAIFVKRN